DPAPTPTPNPAASPSPTPGDDHGGGGGGGGGDDHGGDDHPDLSLHGLYEGTTSAGGIAVFYIERNTHIQINLLDISGQSIGFAEGQLTNGAFTFTLSNGQSISGTATEKTISGTVGNATFQAIRASEFGEEHRAAGRFVGTANGPGGESRVMIVVDSNKHIVLLQTSGTAPNLVRTGGFGSVTAPVSPSTTYTFTLDKTVGSSSPITGSFTIQDGVFAGTFTTSAGTFTINSFKSTLVNRMANISTRGLVGQGDSVLIGGFIITGGPKLVMIRAIGPSLAAFGVSPALDNPSIKLFANGVVLKQNDDWKSNANAADIVASGLAPTSDLESALLVRLEPGAYTTVVTGTASSAIGIGLVEVYEVDRD
ncbi:MAG: hypothetical protein ACJ8HQ_03480, partial [Chthoniobacterales bacterium]